MISVLKYAKEIGAMDVPQIKDWKDHAHDVSCFWGTIDVNYEKNPEFTMRSLLNDPILVEGRDCDSLPIRLTSNGDAFPYLSDDKLLFLTPSQKGDFRPDTNYILLRDKTAIIRGELNRDDLPYLMEGIYKLYARHRQEVPQIMRELVN